MNCDGTENELDQCSYLLDYDNPPNSIAGVVCENSQGLFLINQTLAYAVNDFSYLGPICSENWSMKEAQVFCQQLENSQALNIEENSKSWTSLTPYSFEGLLCQGNEKSLLDCKTNREISCAKDQIAQVQCENT